MVQFTGHTSLVHILWLQLCLFKSLEGRLLLLKQVLIPLDLLLQVFVFKSEVLHTECLLMDAVFDLVKLVECQISFLFCLCLHVSFVEHVNPAALVCCFLRICPPRLLQQCLRALLSQCHRVV